MILDRPTIFVANWKVESTVKAGKTFRKNEDKNVKKIKIRKKQRKTRKNENKTTLRDNSGPPNTARPTFIV